jgi:carboxyl-terminal processing protease
MSGSAPPPFGLAIGQAVEESRARRWRVEMNVTASYLFPKRLVRHLAVWALVAVLLLGLGLPARAADGTLVLAALQVLERNYVEPVHSVDLLNAAVTALREATGQSQVALPPIPAGDSEEQTEAAFTAEFERAVQAGTIPETQLAYASTRAMLASLHDSHTYYMEPSQWAQFRQQLGGTPGFSGIGAVITSRADYTGTRWIFVEDVFPGSPAEIAGLRRFDRVLQVGGTSLRNATPEEASGALRGPTGSAVELTVQRGNQELRISVVRAPIQEQPVEARLIQPGIAYVRLFEFSQGAGRHLRIALEDLAAKTPLRSIILDLRGNPGGLIIEAARVGSLFLPSGTTLARVTDREHGPSLLPTSGAPPFADVPLAVLVDRRSASGSEIIVGALKDAHRAAIVGELTAGALGGATTAALPEGGMSVTMLKITTPLGTQVEGVGLTPDAAVSLTEADMERGEDTQLRAALQVLGAMGTYRLLRAA